MIFLFQPQTYANSLNVQIGFMAEQTCKPNLNALPLTFHAHCKNETIQGKKPKAKKSSSKDIPLVNCKTPLANNPCPTNLDNKLYELMERLNKTVAIPLKKIKNNENKKNKWIKQNENEPNCPTCKNNKNVFETLDKTNGIKWFCIECGWIKKTKEEI